MTRERDPRVVAIAEALSLAYPYGFEYVKNGPSAADYHAAIIAVKTLDGDVEYEYNLRVEGDIFYSIWSTEKQMIDLWLDGTFKGQTLQELKEYLAEYWPQYVLVRRLKSEIEEV